MVGRILSASTTLQNQTNCIRNKAMNITKLAVALIASLVAPFSLQADNNLPITAAQRQKSPPDAVLADLMEGNKRYVAVDISELNIKDRVKASSKERFPQAVILSCLDFRVPVDDVFDQGFGNILSSASPAISKCGSTRLDGVRGRHQTCHGSRTRGMRRCKRRL